VKYFVVRYPGWDFTCPDTLAPSHETASGRTVDSTASQAEEAKRVKHAELTSSGGFLFYPVAIETLGA